MLQCVSGSLQSNREKEIRKLTKLWLCSRVCLNWLRAVVAMTTLLHNLTTSWRGETEELCLGLRCRRKTFQWKNTIRRMGLINTDTEEWWKIYLHWGTRNLRWPLRKVPERNWMFPWNKRLVSWKDSVVWASQSWLETRASRGIKDLWCNTISMIWNRDVTEEDKTRGKSDLIRRPPNSVMM